MDAVLYTVLAFGVGALGIFMFYVLWNATDTFGKILAFLGVNGIELWIVMHTIERVEILVVFLAAYALSQVYITYTTSNGLDKNVFRE